MRGVEDNLQGFRSSGVQPVAISVDATEQSRDLAQKAGFHFALLSDPNAAVIRRYGVLHQGPETGGQAMARPAEFLLDPSGIVRWRNLTGDYRVRARPDEMLEAVRSALR